MPSFFYSLNGFLEFWDFSGLVASNALGIGAVSFASKSGTSFGDGTEVAELVEVPRSCFDFACETEIKRAKI